MEPGEKFVCHLEALATERPEFCSGGVCCGIYKQQTILPILVLWTVVLIILVLPVLYYTIICVPRDRLTDQGIEEDQQEELELYSTEYVQIGANKKQPNEQSLNQEKDTKDNIEIDNHLNKIRPHKDSSKIYAKNARMKDEKRIEEDNTLRNKRQSPEQQSIHNENINDRDKDIEKIKEDQESVNKNDELLSIERKNSFAKGSVSSKQGKPLENQGFPTNNRQKNNKGNQPDEETRSEEENTVIKENQYTGNDKTTNTDLILRSSKQTQVNFKLGEYLQQNNKKDNVEEVIFLEKLNSRRENYFEDVYPTQQENNRIEVDDKLRGAMKDKSPRESDKKSLYSTRTTISRDDESQTQKKTDGKDQLRTADNTGDEIRKQLNEDQEEHVTAIDGLEERAPKFQNTGDDSDEENPKKETIDGKDNYLSTSLSRDEENTTEQNMDGNDFVTSKGNRDVETQTKRNIDGKDNLLNSLSRDKDTTIEQNMDGNDFLTTKPNKEEETPKEQNNDTKDNLSNSRSRDENTTIEPNMDGNDFVTTKENRDEETLREQNNDVKY